MSFSQEQAEPTVIAHLWRGRSQIFWDLWLVRLPYGIAPPDRLLLVLQIARGRVLRIRPRETLEHTYDRLRIRQRSL